MLFLAFMCLAFVGFAQPDDVELDPIPDNFNPLTWFFWFKSNIAEVVGVITTIIALLDVLLRLTPTEKDNNALRVIQSWLDKIVPNKRDGGGIFTAYEKKEDVPIMGAYKESSYRN